MPFGHQAWQQLLATYSDAAWTSIIEGAKARGLDLDFTSADGESILYMTARRGYERTAKLLLEYKVDTGVQVSAMGNDFGNTALHVLVSNVQTERDASLRSWACCWRTQRPIHASTTGSACVNRPSVSCDRSPPSTRPSTI